MAYITKADVEGLLGAFAIPAHWTADSDAFLNLAIARAEQAIEAFTRNRFEQTSRTLLLSGDGTEYLPTIPITSWPISSIASIRVRDSIADDFDDDGDAVDSDDYCISQSRHSVYREDDVWEKGVKNYRVRATFGYATVPGNVKRAAVILVQEEITPGTSQGFSRMDSESFPDGYSYKRSDRGRMAIPSMGSTTGIPLVDSMLAPYQCGLPGMFRL